MRVLVTRSKEDATPLMEELGARNIEAVLAPLLEIKFFGGPVLNLEGVQALLMTSANGVRAFSKRSNDRDLRVVAVGDATAQAARGHGFDNIISAAGDVDHLASAVIRGLKPEDGAVLHPAGTTVAGCLEGLLGSAGYNYRRVVLYEAKGVDRLPIVARDGFLNGAFDGVLIYSPRTGVTFRRLVVESGLASTLDKVCAFCLSANVMGSITGLPWASIFIAPRPEQAALLALLDKCVKEGS